MQQRRAYYPRLLSACYACKHQSMELTRHQYIAELVIGHRKRGAFLPYRDYQVIEKWLHACSDFDFLFLLLAEMIPVLFAKNPNSSLTRIERTVMRKISLHRNKV